MERHDVAVFGAAGYSGLELVKLLATHPGVRLVCAASDAHAGRPLRELTGRDHGDQVFATAAAARDLAAGCAAVLLAVPPEPARELTAALRAGPRPPRVIDLSHAHRGDPAAVYGLASLFAGDVPAAEIVANPGCYATGAITAAAPLVRRGLVAGDLAISAGSGVTGAGKSSDQALSLGEMYGEVRAYKVLRHQHVPEIEAALARVADGPLPAVVLTTHLLPIARGIFGTLTVRLARPLTTAELVAAYRVDYAGDPTVWVEDTPEAVALRRVVGTAAVQIGVASDARGIAVIVFALDNLLKGAASQAVENLNAVLGQPRLAGLAHLARLT